MLKKLTDFLEGKHRKLWLVSGSITWKECMILLISLLGVRSIVEGEAIKKYEQEFRRYLGAKYAFSFGAGRMAFYAILKAIGVEKGDEVILPGYTCVVVPDAVIYCGAKPVYVDIDRSTLNIDVSKIEEKLSPRTKVICAQHTSSSFCKMEEIMKIAKKHDLKVIEDCAHALGAEYNGKKAGNFGHAAYFTTEQSKIISTGMGGVAVTNDAKIATRIQEIQANSDPQDDWTSKKVALQILLFYFIFHPSMHFFDKYAWMLMNKFHLYVESTTKEELEGQRPKKYPVKLSNIQAKLGLAQLKRIQSNLQHRREIAKIYEGWLRIHGYEVPTDDDDRYEPSYIRYWF
jgi:dTDP-4-amino-4,6-dideoxygalactose transaminase